MIGILIGSGLLVGLIVGVVVGGLFAGFWMLRHIPKGRLFIAPGMVHWPKQPIVIYDPPLPETETEDAEPKQWAGPILEAPQRPTGLQAERFPMDRFKSADNYFRFLCSALDSPNFAEFCRNVKDDYGQIIPYTTADGWRKRDGGFVTKTRNEGDATGNS